MVDSDSLVHTFNISPLLMQVNLDGVLFFVLGMLIAIIGFFMKRLIDQQDIMKSCFETHVVENATELLRKDDFRNEMKDIKEMLNKIFDKLDTKADKADKGK